MKPHDFEDKEYLRTRDIKNHRKTAHQRGIRSILRDLTLLDGLLVYWNKPENPSVHSPLNSIPSIREQLAKRLCHQAPGLYLVNSQSGSTPTIASVKRTVLKHAQDALSEARRQRHSIPDEVEQTLNAYRKRLNFLYKVLSHFSTGTNDDMVFVELHCLWLAEENERPSHQHHHAQSSEPLEHALSAWPIELIAQLPIDKELRPALLGVVRSFPQLNHIEVALITEELILRNRRIDLIAFLSHLALLIATVQEATQESERRFGILLQACTQLSGGRMVVLHPEFIADLQKYFEHHYPQLTLGKEHNHLHHVIYAMFGYQFHRSSMRRLSYKLSGQQKAFDIEDFAQRMSANMAPVNVEQVNQLTLALGLQAARFAALSNDATAPSAMGCWVTALRDVCTPGKSGMDAVELAVRSMDRLENQLRNSPYVTRGIIAHLPEFAPQLAQRLTKCLYGGPATLQRHREAAAHEGSFALLDLLPHVVAVGATDPTHIKQLISPRVRMIYQARPGLFPECLDFFVRYSSTEIGAFNHWLETLWKEDEKRTLRFLETAGRFVEKKLFPHHQLPDVIENMLLSMDHAELPSEFVTTHLPALERRIEELGQLMQRHAQVEMESLSEWVQIFSATLTIGFYWEKTYGAPPAKTCALFSEKFQSWFIHILKHTGKTTAPAFPFPQKPLEVFVILCGGDVQALMRMIKEYNSSGVFSKDFMAGWHCCKRNPELRATLTANAQSPREFSRVIQLLNQIRRLSRFLNQQQLGKELTVLESRPPLQLPSRLPDYAHDTIHAIAQARSLCGDPPTPKSLLKCFDLQRRLEGERDRLRARSATKGLNDTEQIRLERVDHQLAQPEQLEVRIRADFEKHSEKLLRLERLRAAEIIVQRAVLKIWKVEDLQIENGKIARHWENAMKFSGEINANRRIYRRLLRALATGDNDWIDHHPANQQFLTEMRGKPGDVQTWQEMHTRSATVNGSLWSAYTEDDPLWVMMMGTLFNTCLSWDGINAYSAIANAVEVNKRVLYVTDGSNIIGRRLIVLTRSGIILPFDVYQAEQKLEHYVTILLDQLTVQIAQDCGYTITNEIDVFDDEKKIQQEIRLFADWYFDYSNDMDFWQRQGVDPQKFSTDTLVTFLRKHEAEDFGARIRLFIAAGQTGIDALQQFPVSAYDEEDRAIIARYVQAGFTAAQLT